MSRFFSIKPQKSQLLGALVLLGMTAVFFKLAVAITAFTPQNQPTGYVAQDEVSNYNLTGGNETLYRPEYEKEFWSGNLYAYPVDAAGNVDIASERWSGGAKVHIDTQNYSSGRLIATMKDDGTKIPFLSANMSAAQQGALAATIQSTSYTSTQIVNFLRGDRSNEGSTALRQRASALGDIVHSRPYYVTDATTPTVFVGANDGMLHAVNATDGSERWAYVPSMLLSKMKNLAANPYTHDYYMDGQINIGNVTISGASKRVLAGGLGAGGKGLFALDITNLAAAAESDVASKILWEVTPTKVNYANPATANAYVNLGYTYGTPLIAKVHNGASTIDVVIIGNGYNDNTTGNYQAFLYVIDVSNGQLVRAIQAGTSGTAGSPNGLSSSTALDNDSDGAVDVVYAGDLNGTLWRFDVENIDPAAWSATAKFTTSPAQPITSTPGIALHPNGGYMISFGTGAIFTTADTTDTSVHYVYGIWDGAPVANTTLVTQTLEERSYTDGTTTTRVRRSTAIAPNWNSGGNKGWKVALPAGERVLGEGSFTENGRFYFSSHNPTVAYAVPNTTTTVYGENWLMELNYLSGGSSTQPFLDMDGNLLLNDSDRIKYTATDTLPAGKAVGDPIPGTDGIPVGKWLSRGVQSQPILVQLQTLNTTLFNQNPDVTFPAVSVERGVAGGHFDEDVYYGSPICGSTTSGGSGATATITVGSTGSSLPATLGGILVDGNSIVGALTTSDITNGTASSTNATTIKNKVGGGFTATVSGSTITVTAPVGVSYNGKTFTFLPGTSQAGSAGTPAVRPTGLIIFGGGTTSSSSNAKINDDLSGSKSVKVGGTSASSNTITIGKSQTPSQAASTVANEIGTGGTIKAYVGGNSITPRCASQSSNVVCLVDTSTYGNGSSVTIGSTSNFNTLTVSTSATSGGDPGSAATGWDDFAPALTGGTFSGGADGTVSSYSSCQSDSHTHQYDDKFDKTGVNMLNASVSALNLSNGITSTSTQFKVLAQNQYLSPAVKIHIGNPSYVYNVDSGYTSIKNFVTSANLDITTLPTYDRSNIGSLAINMPVDAFTPKNWWGNGDVRVGLHPTETGCVKRSAGTGDSNLYQPVMPPANGVDGPGVDGSAANGWAGARHNGALVIQIIKAATPQSAIEENVAGRPEYGWRVKKEFHDAYVLTEYTTFWHHPTSGCYGDATWSKNPGTDSGSSTPVTPAAGSTDPKIGDLSGGGGTVASTTTTVQGNVTTITITYLDDTTATIVRTANDDGTVTIVTTDASGNVTTEIVANTSGSVRTGGDERGLQARTGRVSWHELIRD